MAPDPSLANCPFCGEEITQSLAGHLEECDDAPRDPNPKYHP